MESSRTESAAPEIPTSYRWESPSKRVAVLLDFDVVDQLNFDVMKGFGAVPRRGAEVGGLLLGTVEPGDQTTVHVSDYASVPCQHARGPSFILSDADTGQLEDLLARWAPAPGRRTAVVGFYRSNTRDLFELSPEDQALLDGRLHADGTVALLIKPFATRIAEAALFTREDGAFTTGPAEAFPFRRKEMGGGAGKPPRGPRTHAPEPPTPALHESEPAASMAMPDRVETVETAPSVRTPSPLALDEGPIPVQAPAFIEAPDDLSGEPAPSRFRSGWIWIPLSFIFLLLGVVLGFQIAISFRSGKPATPQTDPYSMGLTAARFGESLQLKWNLDSAPLSQAQRGLLTIHDGPSAKIVELSREDLARGSVLYRNLSDAVRFRLEVFPRERNSVMETIEVKVAGGPADSSDAANQAARKARRK